jgi:hypothetical protein
MILKDSGSEKMVICGYWRGIKNENGKGHGVRL